MPIFADRDPKNKLTGKWRAQVRVDGKTIKSTRFDTYQEAVAWESENRLDSVDKFVAEKKASFRGPKMTLGDLYVKGSGAIWRGQESEKISEMRFRILVKMLGPDLPLDDITTVMVDELIDKLVKGRKGATVNRYLSNLHTALEWAFERKYLKEMPVMDWQEEDEGRIRWITAEEEQRLYQLLEEKYARLVYVAIRTGMRRGELLSLKYENVTPKKVYLWKTKNKTARTVHINQTTHENLMWLLDNGMPNERSLRYAWDKARAEMGLTDDPYFVFHVCRHTCCTRLVEANVNLRVIQVWMGHKRIETTIRYAQIKNSMLEDALTKQDDFDHVRWNYIHERSNPPVKTTLVEHMLREETEIAIENAQRLQCGRGGTGRRAGFRSSDDDEKDE